MATSGKGTGIVGYNVQIAVDAEHHLVVAHEVTNIGSDRAQPTSMGGKAREATGCEEVTVLVVFVALGGIAIPISSAFAKLRSADGDTVRDTSD